MSTITLTTDFGGTPGVMKGVIWRIAPEAKIADLSHDINPQNVRQAALYLDREVYYFPDNTVHVVVVDPGVGTRRRPIAAQLGPQRFVGPDNGVFTPMLLRAEQAGWPIQIVHTDKPDYWLPEVSDIFHGRDIFAPVAAHWAAGVPLEALGTPMTDPVRIDIPRPKRTERGIEGEIALIFPHFGNIITNIHRTDLAGAGSFNVTLNGTTIKGLVRTFGEREPGTLIALFGSSGYVMISVVNGNAAQRLKARVGDRIEVTPQKA